MVTQEQIAQAEAQVKNFKPVPFPTAFETLALEAVRLQAVMGGSDRREALINGKLCPVGSTVALTLGGLPAILTCASIDKASVTLTFGSSRRTYTLRPKAR